MGEYQKLLDYIPYFEFEDIKFTQNPVVPKKRDGSIASRIIKDAVPVGKIKPLDPDTAPRYMNIRNKGEQ